MSRARIKYSLRLVFCLVSILAIIMAPIAVLHRAKLREELAAQRLDIGIQGRSYIGPENLSGALSAWRSLHRISEIRIGPDTQARKALRIVGDFRYVRVIEVDSDCINDRDLDSLAAVGNLQELIVRGNGITGEFVESLTDCRCLELFAVEGVCVSCAGLQALSRLPYLKAVHLNDCKIDEESIWKLFESASVEFVDVRWSSIDQATVKAIRSRYVHVTVLSGG